MKEDQKSCSRADFCIERRGKTKVVSNDIAQIMQSMPLLFKVTGTPRAE